MAIDGWPPPWGQEPVSQTPPVTEDTAVVGGEWVAGQGMVRPPRLVAWANRSRRSRWREAASPQLIAALALVAAAVLVAVAI